MHLGPGAHGHYSIDAKTFANWNVDYVKLDGCYVQGIDLNTAYPAFGQALNKTGRPMVYSCSWPFYQNNVRCASRYLQSILYRYNISYL